MIDRLKVKCPDCNGSGKRDERYSEVLQGFVRCSPYDCGECDGSGEVLESDPDYIDRLRKQLLNQNRRYKMLMEFNRVVGKPIAINPRYVVSIAKGEDHMNMPTCWIVIDARCEGDNFEHRVYGEYNAVVSGVNEAAKATLGKEN